jgi:hypothetical protein
VTVEKISHSENIFLEEPEIATDIGCSRAAREDGKKPGAGSLEYIVVRSRITIRIQDRHFTLPMLVIRNYVLEP